ncbi:MAG: ABC transporter substrate binding protein [Arcobacteraceae bacterium]
MRAFLFILLFSFSSLFAKEILLLHSYHKGYVWSDEISRNIEQTLFPYENIELTTVYMDTKRNNTQEYLDTLALLYKKQFENRKFDLIITADNNAFDFAIKHKSELFLNLPILFCGLNNLDKKVLEQQNMTHLVSGVIEQVDIEKNFELIATLHPNTKKLLIINDKSITGLAVKQSINPIIQKYQSHFEIEYIDNMNINTIEQKVTNLSKDSIILFILFSKDKQGEYFTYKKGFKKIKESANVPIYGLWDFYLGHGLVGGLLTSAVSQGRTVSKMAIDILNNNTNIADIPIIDKSPNHYIFDLQEIQKYKIDLHLLKKKYTLVNEPVTIYKKYKKFFIISSIVIIILSIVVMIMRANIQRRKILERDLQNVVKFDKVLLNTMPSAIYYKNKDGKVLGSNQAFADLFKMRKQDIIGKTAHDFYPEELAFKNENIDKELFKTLGTNKSEITLHFDDMSMKHIILNKAVYLNSDGTIGGIVCIMDDITERLQQKQFLIQQGKLAEMGDMIAAIAHQWNEPLVELSAQVQDIQTSYLLDELQTVNVDKFVNESMVQIKYMSKTLSDFRNFLKPSTKRVLFSVKESFDEIFEIIGKQIFYSNIDLEILYPNDKSELLIYGYENEFKQVLLNIINNAKNKIIDKEVDGNFKITISVKSDEKNTIIKISDNGGTIDEKVIHSIFDPYFTTKKDGTGFGLYMAKVIIEDKMQGHINVHNQNDLVIFSLKIPHIVGDEDENIIA